MSESTKKDRIWEIDFFRGIALVLMITFHLIFDLNELYNFPVKYSSGLVYYVGKTSAILFMLIAGISSSFSRSNIKRGMRIFVIAMVITLSTYLFDPGLIIKFGILHFFGVSMILSPLFKNMNKYLLVILGTMVIITGNYFSTLDVNVGYLFPIGLYTRSFYSSDYYPIFPWFGIFLYGMALSKILYEEKKSLFKFTLKNNPVSFMGKYSLIVYIIHQPLTLLLLSLFL